jgi:acyl-coenzyme A thioesterase PaaI-like protein
MVGHALVLSGGFGFLGTLNVRFAHPVPVGERLTGVARVDGQERRKVFVSGELSSASGLLASASAILITAPKDDAS